MALPTEAIDRLFQRLGATYGRAWTAQWDGVPINDVKAAWAHELAGYEKNLKTIAWALENLPERCPNVIEFRNLCRLAPVKEAPQLSHQKADPERVKAELAKLAPLRDALKANPDRVKVDHKAWAKRILKRYEDGEKVPHVNLSMARRALGLEQ